MSTKYPCCSCGIGVKYSGILCTSNCNMWYHAGCQKIPERDLKKWTPNKVKIWKCTSCTSYKDKLTGDNANTSTNSDTLNHSIKELEIDLIENKNLENTDSDEEKLEMAAKIGAALLEENTFLKGKNETLQTKLATFEEQLEEMEQKEEKYTHKIENLMQLIKEMEAQIDKEKLLRSQIEDTFEQHDKKQNQLIEGYIAEISDLERTITSIKKHQNNHENNSKQESVITKNAETQTTTLFNYPNPAHDNMTLTTEVINLRTQLNKVELNLEYVQNMLKKDLSITSNKYHNKTRSACTKTRTKNHFSISLQVQKHSRGEENKTIPQQQSSKDTPTTKEQVGNSGGDSQTPSQKLNPKEIMTTNSGQITNFKATVSTGVINQTPPKKLPTSTVTENSGQTTTSQATPSTGGSSQTPSEKLTTSALTGVPDMMTILQPTAATGGTSQTPSEKLPITALKGELDRRTTGSMKRERKPPMTAKLMSKGETYEEFLNRELKSHTLNKQSKNSPSPHTTLNKESETVPILAHFLELHRPEKERHKPISVKQITRIFWKSTLQKI